MSPRWIEAKQGSDAWLKSRIGNLTASRMADAMSVTKTGESEKRRRLKLEILAERLSGRATECYVNAAMQWGIEQEKFAREAYENSSGDIVQIVGLAMHDTIEHLGASCDGLIDEDSVWECKCPNTATFLTYKLENVMPPAYKPQLLLQMLVTGRKRGIFTAYDPRLPDNINLFVKEYVPEQSELDKTEEAAVKFLAEVADLHRQILG